MANRLFSQVPAGKPRRNVFDLSHDVKMSMDMGVLTPILCQEVVPGDTWSCSTEVMMRLAPMVAPMMHRCNIKTDFFFVPNRLVWDEWETFITGGEEGTEQPVFPHLHLDHFLGSNFVGSLADYLGVPDAPSIQEPDQQWISTLPFRAYQLIYNEYYRDQNLTDPVEIYKGSGQEPEGQYLNLTPLRRRAWEKDYFTSALPWAQRGEPVLLPFGGISPVLVPEDGHSGGGRFRQSSNGTVPYGNDGSSNALLGRVGQWSSSARLGTTTSGSSESVYYDPNGSMSINVDESASITINDLRRSIRLQEWLEKNARGGGRYIEQILSHFGVRSSDSRLQRPEYLGGGKTPIKVSEVLQTSSSDDITPQANMAGHGIAVGRTHRFRKFFEEHGLIIGLISVIPRTSYQQGLPRYFTKFDKMDFYWPEFANLGEQPVYNREIYVGSTQTYRDGTFGYQPRYAEYKYIPSSVHGEMRNTLDFWHMGRIFSPTEENYPPALNTEFVECRPTERIWAVLDSEERLYCHIFHKIRAKRPMPKFGVPLL